MSMQQIKNLGAATEDNDAVPYIQLNNTYLKVDASNGPITGKLDFTGTENVNARFQKGFVVKKTGENIDGANIFSVYNDFIEYDGPTNGDLRIANRKWIWNNTVRDWDTTHSYSQLLASI